MVQVGLQKFQDQQRNYIYKLIHAKYVDLWGWRLERALLSAPDLSISPADNCSTPVLCLQILLSEPVLHSDLCESLKWHMRCEYRFVIQQK